MQNETKTTDWIDVSTIQREFLPISKKKIRAIIKENLDVTFVGTKVLVEKSQLISFLRKEI